MSDLVDVRVIGAEVSIRTWAARTDVLADELASVFARPEVASAKRLGLSAITPSGSSSDFGWAVGLATSVSRDSLQVSAGHVTYRAPLQVADFYSDTSFASYEGTFAGVRTLMLRDWRVEWKAPRWPDATTLTLASLHAETVHTCAWIELALADVDAWPQLHTLRLHRPICEALLPALVESPILRRLRVLDMHGAITNHGARVLHDHADRFASLEEIYVGAAPYRALARTVPLERGERDIDDAWSSRLRAKLGNRLRFKEPRR